MRPAWLALGLALLSSPAGAQAEKNPLEGLVVGRVYEVDKERYRDWVQGRRSDERELEESLRELDPFEFVDEQEEVTVSGRQLATNASFLSEESSISGDYAIRETPIGTYQFSLSHEGVEYPVQQRLDLNVQLSYVAELCFVIDREEQVAWMVADGVRRTADVPPWVPRHCMSNLSECLAYITDPEGALPDGLLLLLAGAGSTATAIGIISADQVEASSPEPREQQR